MLLAIHIVDDKFSHDDYLPAKLSFDSTKSEITILALGGVSRVHVLTFDGMKEHDAPIMLVANRRLIGVKGPRVSSATC